MVETVGTVLWSSTLLSADRLKPALNRKSQTPTVVVARHVW